MTDLHIDLHLLEMKPTLHDPDARLHPVQDSPILRLSFDLLHKILQDCLPIEHNTLMSVSEVPVSATHVCQEWRNQILQMPLLWSSIYIPIPDYPPPKSSHSRERQNTILQCFVEDRPDAADRGQAGAAWAHKVRQRGKIVQEWLRRAGGSTLSISFVQWNAPIRLFGANGCGIHTSLMTEAQEAPVKEIVDTLLCHSAQWRDVEIRSASWRIAMQFLSLPASEAPNLESLCISVGTARGSGLLTAASASASPGLPVMLWSLCLPRFPDPSIVTAPRLRCLDLRSIPHSLAEIPVRWESLTRFFFYGYAVTVGSLSHQISFSPNDALLILDQCASLVECGLAIGSKTRSFLQSASNTVSLQEPLTPRQALVKLPCLETLWIHEQKAYPLENFLLSLDVPKLISFKFMTNIDSIQEELEDDNISAAHAPRIIQSSSSLPTFLRAWGANIRTLEFDHYSQTTRQLRECLRMVPHVERLSLYTSSKHSINLGGVEVHSPWVPGEVPASAKLGDGFLKEFIPPTGLSQAGEPSAGCLCSCLVELKIRIMGASEFDEEALLGLIGRQRSTQRLVTGPTPLQIMEIDLVPGRHRKVASSASPRNSEVFENLHRTGTWPALNELCRRRDLNLSGLKVELTRTEYRSESSSAWAPSWGLLDKKSRRVYRTSLRFDD